MFKKSLMLVALMFGGSVVGVGCGAEAPSGGDEPGDEQAGDTVVGEAKIGESQEAVQTTCGGITGRPCGGTNQCVDDPNDDCDPDKGGSDCGGICVGDPCGGFGGFGCEKGYACVDDPRDDCDPEKGGADCPGMCLHEGEIE